MSPRFIIIDERCPPCRLVTPDSPHLSTQNPHPRSLIPTIACGRLHASRNKSTHRPPPHPAPPQVSAAIAGLADLKIPKPEGQRQGRAKTKSRLRGLLVTAVKSALKVAVSETVSALPFGSIAVSLCEDTAARIHVLKENKEAVTVLIEVSVGRCARRHANVRGARPRSQPILITLILSPSPHPTVDGQDFKAQRQGAAVL